MYKPNNNNSPTFPTTGLLQRLIFKPPPLSPFIGFHFKIQNFLLDGVFQQNGDKMTLKSKVSDRAARLNVHLLYTLWFCGEEKS